MGRRIAVYLGWSAIYSATAKGLTCWLGNLLALCAAETAALGLTCFSSYTTDFPRPPAGCSSAGVIA